MKKAICNGIIYTGREKITGSAILIADQKILAVVPESQIPKDFSVIDLEGKNISPAFIDLQIYGGDQHLFSADPNFESLEKIHEYCLRGGCANFLVTVATNAEEVVSKCIAAVKNYLNQDGKGLMGLHLEGPWINPEKRGAHPEKYIHPPKLDEVKKIIDQAEGVIKMITLAPEVVDEKIIDYLLENNIVVSAGHSNATYQQTMKSFKKIKVATHLFNGMSPFQSREPGMVGAIYDHPTVYSSIVADGVHVDYASIRISKQIMGERLFLITDSVAGSTNLPYQHIFKNNSYVMPDGTLSGSALSMMKAVKNCNEFAGIELEEALRMASLYPARILSLQNNFGRIEKGFEVSFVVFDNECNHTVVFTS